MRNYRLKNEAQPVGRADLFKEGCGLGSRGLGYTLKTPQIKLEIALEELSRLHIHEEIIPVPDADPVRVLVDRFSRATLGAAPWGWSFARDLRLQALARDAVTPSPESDGAPT